LAFLPSVLQNMCGRVPLMPCYHSRELPCFCFCLTLQCRQAMVKHAWNCARDADEIFFIVDADKILPGRDGRGIRGTEDGTSAADAVPQERLLLKKDTNEELVRSPGLPCPPLLPFSLVLLLVSSSSSFCIVEFFCSASSNISFPPCPALEKSLDNQGWYCLRCFGGCARGTRSLI